MKSLEFGLENIFEDHEKKDIGNKREVWEVKGKEGVDFFIKARQSDDELLALRFLSETGVSEKLLTFDNDNLLIEKVKGGFASDYLRELVAQHPLKIVEVKPSGTQGSSRFKIASTITSEHLPLEVLLEDEKVEEVFEDYLSKSLFLILNGIIHKDIKADNVLVDEKGSIKFIDFGEAAVVDHQQDMDNLVILSLNDLFKTLELLQVLNPMFGDISKKIVGNKKLEDMIKSLYLTYKEQNIDLPARSSLLLHWIDNRELLPFFAELGLPKEIIDGTERKIKELVALV